MADASSSSVTANSTTAPVNASASRHGTVIKSMVERFRFGSPLSRTERAKLKEKGDLPEFWWQNGGAPPNGNSSFTEAANNGPEAVLGNLFDPRASFASFMPETVGPASFRYAGAQMPATPGSTARPISNA